MDQVKSNFFENQILEAIETVTTGIVSKLQFDQTILCTITNDNKRKNGEYEVSDGSSTFKAFSSDTNYKKDMAVYVLVPQGDFERQKTIVGKYVDDTASAINYIPASQSIIEVVKPVMSQEEYGLLANGTQKAINIVENINWFNTNIYDCVSLKARFKTDLSKYNIIDGDYGLILTLGRCESAAAGEPPKLVFSKFYKFSCKDMFGDPYNYNTYFDQDIVFNLFKDFSNIKINYYRLDFYQNGKFKDLNGNDIPCKDDINNINFNNNLFVKDIQMSFGYSTVDIKEEGIQIYTPDNLKYISRLPAKNIVLKWFQKNEVGNNTAYGVIDTLDEAEGNNYSVYWYRYRIGASEDELAGAFWELLDAGAFNDNIDYSYEIVKDPNGKYTYKDGKLILANSDTKQDDKYKMEIKIKIDPDPKAGRYEGETSTDDPYNIQFAPDRLLNREKIKAILVKHEIEEIQEVDKDDSDIIYITFEYSPKIYESNEIVFENANPASLSLAAVDLIKNMRLECTDNSNGVYKLYNAVDNEIINNENTKERTLNVLFDTYSSKDIPKDAEQCKITWKIPRYNSMINPVNFTINNNLNKPPEEGDPAGIQTFEKNEVEGTWNEYDSYYVCSYDWNSNIAGFDSVHKDAELSMKYSIDKFYSQSYSNNTIICEIEKYGKTYTKEIEFIFGETGTNGTGYTVSLKLEKEYNNEGKAVTATAVPCVTENGNKVKIIASLFDEHGNDISAEKVFKWNWLNNNVSGFECDAIDNEKGTAYCHIQHDRETPIGECYGILSATVAGEWLNKNVQLTGYLPLGIRSKSSLMETYEGTTKIIYNEQGIKPTYQKEHSLGDVTTSEWKVKVLEDDDNEWKNYSPYFKTRQTGDIGPWILMARDMYFSDLKKEKIVIQAINGTEVIYSQSLLYDQNRFGNAMFNNWDGSLVVDEKGNKILAAIIGAGKKDNKNTFTGVIMGETTTDTGLFGYYQGVQTFGFNTNGTAFIGASDAGQIRFDGAHGTIKSATGNTELDLENGRIYLSNGTDGTANITIDSNKTYSGGYFSIKHLDSTNGDKTLIYIGDNNYYLQSKEFAHPSTKTITEEGKDPEEKYFPGTGVRFDLAAGKLTGYDFEMRAGQADKELIITSDPKEEPLKIGSKFKVNWDGTLTASDGTFTGEITAETGNIGGWTIVKNALYKNTSVNTTVPTTGDDKGKLTEYKAVSDSALIAPDYDVAVTGLDFKTYIYKEGTTDTDEETGIVTTTEGKWEQTKANISNIVFTIGTNFAIDKDGTIYASGAKLDGIVYQEDVDTLSSTLIDIAQGNLDWEAHYRQTADADEAAARTEEDNKLDGRIGTVNLNNNGLISQVGEYNGKSIFVDHTIASGRAFVVEGYYEDETTFYDKTIGYETEITPLSKYQSYYDIDNKQYYKSYDNSTLTPVDDTSSDVDKNFVIRGYYYNGKIYQKKTYVKSSSQVSKNSSTIYLDIDTGLAYLYEDSKFRLTTPDDNIVMFMVDNEGLLTAANAVIAGTIYAHDGYIGGWTIQHVGTYGGLTYGNNYKAGTYSKPWEIDATGANLTPGDGLYIQNSSLFGSTSPKKQCVFNVGQKFAVDKNGVLYADGAVLNGYASNSEFGALKDQVSSDITSLTEKVNYWTDKYGIIVKYKEDENNAYFITNMPVGISFFKKGTFTPEDYFIESGAAASEKMNSKTIYYDTDYSVFYILKNNVKTQVTNLKTFDVSLQGLLQANNAVISGRIYATQGWFTGGISAEEGSIGGWTINKDALYYGFDTFSGNITAGVNTAFIAPKGKTVTGLNSVSSEYTYVDLDLDINGNIQYDASGNIKFKDVVVNKSNAISNNIVLNIGKNFAIDASGVLYAKGAVLGGYATDTSLSEISNDLKSTLNKVNSTLSSEISANTSNIGTVSNKTDGAISSIGTFGSSTVFLSQTYNSKGWKIIEGIYKEGKFYKSTPSYSEKLTLIDKAYYKDLDTGKYYQYNSSSGLQEMTSGTYASIPGYYNYNDEKMYAKKTMETQIKTYLSSYEENTVYLSVAVGNQPAQAYIRNPKKTSELILAEDKKITIFSVSSEGLLYGANAVISGTVYATDGWFSGKITSTTGQIGGWSIESTNLSHTDKRTSPFGGTISNTIKLNNQCTLSTNDTITVEGEKEISKSSDSVSLKSVRIKNSRVIQVSLTTSNEITLSVSDGDIVFDIQAYIKYGDTQSTTSISVPAKILGSTITIPQNLQLVWEDLNFAKLSNPKCSIVFLIKVKTSYSFTQGNTIYGQETVSSNLFGKAYSKLAKEQKSLVDSFINACSLLSINSINNNACITSNSSSTYLDTFSLNRNGSMCFNIKGYDISLLEEKGYFYFKLPQLLNKITFLKLTVNNSISNYFKARTSYKYDTSGNISDQYFTLISSLNQKEAELSFKSNGSLYAINQEGSTYIGTKTRPWTKGFISEINTQKIKASSTYVAASINSSGRNNALIQMPGGFGYYCINSISAGHWLNDTDKPVTSWDVGIDGTADGAGSKYRYCISFSASDKSNIAPRHSFQFMVDADGDKAYFMAKQRIGNDDKTLSPHTKAYLGHNSAKWTGIYIEKGDATTFNLETISELSDARYKEVQSKEILRKILKVYNNLNPIVYKYKNLNSEDQHSRTHVGFLAQEVEKLINNEGLTSEDFAAVQIKLLEEPLPEFPDGKKYYLNYNEFHGLHVLKNQEQDKRILELEQKVQYLENKILELSGKGV